MRIRYKNYGKMKKIFGESVNVYKEMVEYTNFANLIFSTKGNYRLIRQYKNNDDKNEAVIDPPGLPEKVDPPGLPEKVDQLVERITKIMHSDVKRIQKRIDQFIDIEKISINLDPDIKELIKENPEELMRESLKMLINQIIRKPCAPELTLIPDKSNTIIIGSRYHQQKLKELSAHPEIQITENDSDNYIMNNCKFKCRNCAYRYNDNNNQIGYVGLSRSRKYNVNRSHAITDSQEYYERYFDINILKNDSENVEKLNKIISEYLTGFVWVFNYYMNNSTCSWYYPYSHAPLLLNVAKYLNGNKENNVNLLLNKWCMGRNSLPVTRLGYYLFVNPYQKIDKKIVGDEIHREIQKLNNNELFGDYNDIVNRIWDGCCCDIIDTGSYFNKCRIIDQDIVGYDEWMRILERNNFCLDLLYSNLHTFA